MELAERASKDETWHDGVSVINPPANFVRELSGMDPAITSYSAQQYLSTAFDNIGNPLPGVNSSNWQINFTGFNESIRKPQFQFRYNGIGVDFTIRVFGDTSTLSLNDFSPTSRTDTTPPRTAMADIRSLSMTRMSVATNLTEAPQSTWNALIPLPPRTWLTIDSISVYYKLPLLQ